jgi:hypothetical protein
MTRREKLRILKGMKKELIAHEGDGVYFLCWIWSWVTGKHYTMANLTELGLVRPKGVDEKDSFGFTNPWWPTGDYTSRLRALNKAIKKLQP